MREIPKNMVVVGAGVIGVELGSVYSRLGSQVVFVEAASQICLGMDTQISKAFQKILERQGMRFLLNQRLAEATVAGNQVRVSMEGGETLEADVALISVGRRPYTRQLGLEHVGIQCDARGRIPVDDRFWTGVASIYAVGDVIEGPMLAHKASEEAVTCVEGLSGMASHLRYAAIPSVLYTEPEVAWVGLTEEQAKALGCSFKTGTFPLKAVSKARCTGSTDGLMKLIGDEEGRLLGMHIISPHASELITCGVVAIQNQLSVLDLAHLPMGHPSLSEGIKEAALDFFRRAIHK